MDDSTSERPSSANESADNWSVLPLSGWMIFFLLAYFFSIMMISFVLSCSVFFDGAFDGHDYLELAIIGSCSISCMGCSVFYLRKIYKSILNGYILEDSSAGLKAVASLTYYIARPFFAMTFALLVVIVTRAGAAVSGSESEPESLNFVQSVMIVSFFVGFLSGRFLRTLEGWGGNVIEKFSKGA